MSLEFLLTSLLVVASPGTGVVYTIAAGLAQGWRASLVAAFGCTLGCAPHALAAVSGLAALLYASPLALQALSYGGALYLLWMAWGMLREQGPLQLQAHQGARSNTTLIRSGVALNLLNPKLSIFFLAFLPQFLEPGQAHAMQHLLTLSGLFMAVTFAVFSVYGLFAAALRQHLLQRPAVLRTLRYLFAVAFAVLALHLAGWW
ncbi:LysE family translocator [Ectopseudomonas khazarica]|uniref:LysE family translocator n=1 Tax=Ectopseudomonas khazarica TaxID=2502979 RepID=UPI00106E2184|nr:LysE family translocator [Pseudomonas khazarica]